MNTYSTCLRWGFYNQNPENDTSYWKQNKRKKKKRKEKKKRKKKEDPE